MKQALAFDILASGGNVYLTGRAGSGKTHLLRKYITYLKQRGVRVGVTASTGIAATHFGGVTIHSWSGIGIKDELLDEDIEALIQKEYLWKRFDKTRVLIIDEISMLTPRIFDSLERLCRAMKQIDEPFGGMQVVLSGDFFQLPPIVRGGVPVHFVNTSEAWSNMDIRVCYLDEQYRHKDSALEAILNEMRCGSVSLESRELLKKHNTQKFLGSVTPTRLYTHNADVDTLNEKELDKLSGDVHIYKMETKGRKNLVEPLIRGILAPEVLRLKKDAIVMFVKNNFEAGYVNGTLGTVKDFKDGLPVVLTFSGDKITVSPAEWIIEEGDKVLARARQLPLRLAWAITVHKSQGMNMDAAEIDLSKSFVPGQGYVALSRLRTLGGLLLRGINEMAFEMNKNALELDAHLIAESLKLESAAAQLSKDEIKKLHEAFIKKSGGTIDKSVIAKNRMRTGNKANDRVPTHEQTRALIERGMSLKEIAKDRGVTIGTVLSHLEKLRTLACEVDLERFKPRESDLQKIKKAFIASGGLQLAPVHRRLGGKYTYDQLRLARLFL